MFEDALIESSHRKGDSRKATTLPISIAIHGIVIGIALGASIWFVEDVPEPPIPVTFYAAAPPPPPPPPPAAPKAPQPKTPEVQKQVPVRPMEMVAPTIIPENIPKPLAAPEPEAPSGVEGGVEDVKVLKSVNPLLDASAVRAVQQWRYRPATLNGRAVRVYLTVTVTFNLH